MRELPNLVLSKRTVAAGGLVNLVEAIPVAEELVRIMVEFSQSCYGPLNPHDEYISVAKRIRAFFSHI